jgi:hypothetical protein
MSENLHTDGEVLRTVLVEPEDDPPMLQADTMMVPVEYGLLEYDDVNLSKNSNSSSARCSSPQYRQQRTRSPTR